MTLPFLTAHAGLSALLLIVALLLVLASVWWLVRGWRQVAIGAADTEGLRYAVDTAGVVVACVGGAMLAVGSFLPLAEPGGRFAQVQSNTLIQHGGWVLIVLGVGAAVSAYRAYQAGRRSWSTLAIGLIGFVVVVLFAESKSLRTLYPVGLNGQPNSSAPGTVVPLGIAVYVSGIGALLTLIGGNMLYRRAKLLDGDEMTAEAVEATKHCPDCAESVLAAARVCKHCGYRFDEHQGSTTGAWSPTERS